MKKRVWLVFLAVIILTIMILSLENIINDTLGMSIAFLLFIIFCFSVAIIAQKNEINLVKYLMIVFMIISSILLFFSVKAYLKVGKEKSYPIQIAVTSGEKVKMHLFDYGEHKYYTYGLDNITVILNDTHEKYSLNDALKYGKVTLDQILELAIPNQGTVGYKIYYDGGEENKSDDKYSIILCENENRDVIFSTFDYTYDESICN